MSNPILVQITRNLKVYDQTKANYLGTINSGEFVFFIEREAGSSYWVKIISKNKIGHISLTKHEKLDNLMKVV
jgi:hypothetical protein